MLAMPLQTFKELEVWKRAIELVRAVYEASGQLPRSELYGLTSQLKRSAVSVPSNIAEGYKRKSTAEYIQFLSIAEASAAELETQVVIASQLFNEVDFTKVQSLLEETQKMLFSLIRKLSPKS